RSNGPDVGDPVHNFSAHDSQNNSQYTAAKTDDDRFGHKLKGNVPPGRPDGPADPDLLGALGNRRHHDIHDPNAAHQQGDAGDHPQDHIKDIFRFLLLLNKLLWNGHLKIHVVVVPPTQQAADHLGRNDQVFRFIHLYDKLIELVLGFPLFRLVSFIATGYDDHSAPRKVRPALHLQAGSVFEPQQIGFQWNINVAVVIPDA